MQRVDCRRREAKILKIESILKSIDCSIGSSFYADWCGLYQMQSKSTKKRRRKQCWPVILNLWSRDTHRSFHYYLFRHLMRNSSVQHDHRLQGHCEVIGGQTWHDNGTAGSLRTHLLLVQVPGWNQSKNWGTNIQGLRPGIIRWKQVRCTRSGEWKPNLSRCHFWWLLSGCAISCKDGFLELDDGWDVEHPTNLGKRAGSPGRICGQDNRFFPPVVLFKEGTRAILKLFTENLKNQTQILAFYNFPSKGTYLILHFVLNTDS